MIFWFLAALMLVGAALCVLAPLLAPARQDEGQTAGDVYRQQLEALPDDASETERIELSRRLLTATQSGESKSNPAGRGRLVTAIAAAIAIVPAGSLVAYLQLGSPSRAVNPVEAPTSLAERPIEDLVAMAEKRLEQEPDDIRGWKLLATVYGRLNAPAKRAMALRNIMRIEGEDADTLADLGEALTFENVGIVTSEAVGVFQRAIRMAPRHRKAHGYLALALEQEGRLAPALAVWARLRDLAPEGDEFRARVDARIAGLQNRLAAQGGAGPDAEQVANAAQMSGSDRQAMIAGMVDRLAARLEEEPSDFDGWLRLIRSYHVLGRGPDVARVWNATYVRFSDTPEKTKRMEALASELGLKPSNGRLEPEGNG